jgi:hypothetical protein
MPVDQTIHMFPKYSNVKMEKEDNDTHERKIVGKLEVKINLSENLYCF